MKHLQRIEAKIEEIECKHLFGHISGPEFKAQISTYIKQRKKLTKLIKAEA